MTGIAYRRFETPVGRMIAAATENGCCLLEFEDRGGLDRITKRILKRYGAEMIEAEGRILEQVHTELMEYFAAERFEFSAPLDLRGTPFQMAVWRELLSIPYGETRTYGEIAASVGKPKAVRAVGRANGGNYVSIAVPCHRVLQSDGALRGYGGGLWRKRFLLEHEAQSSTAKAAQVGPGAGGDHPAEGLAKKGLDRGLDLLDGQAAPSKDA